MKAAQWKLAADAQNAALAAQYAEWQRKAEEDSKLVQAREQAEAAAALAEKKAEGMRKLQELQERRREMVAEQMRQQRRLITRLETDKGLSTEDRATIMATVKKLASLIEKTKSDTKKVDKITEQIFKIFILTPSNKINN